jgi:ubiquinone/menaquinone biosynthesis C-methylase UbiE
MQQVTQDPWAQWLFSGRFSHFEKEQIFEQQLYPIRDSLLRLAKLQKGDCVLDVGCGDGLIAFAALQKIGNSGMVIFNDISSTLLDHCQNTARSMQVLERCRFLHASVEDLSALSDSSVTVVTARSVLIYVKNKRKAFSQMYRVLQPGGRFAIFEPIPNFATFGNPSFANTFWGYDITHVQEIARKVQAVFSAIEPWGTDPMTNFDARDLLSLAEQVGFSAIKMSISFEALAYQEVLSWEQFLHIQMDPHLPTIQDAMQQALTVSEYEQFSSHLRPLVEGGQGIHRSAWMFLHAIK